MVLTTGRLHRGMELSVPAAYLASAGTACIIHYTHTLSGVLSKRERECARHEETL